MAVRAADEAVAAAPNHREARSLRMKAWESLQSPQTVKDANTVENGSPVRLSLAFPSVVPLGTETHLWQPARVADTSTRRYNPVSIGMPAGPTTPDGNLPLSKRFLLWIDGVGGYLVCLAPRVTFGQATADGPIDVPLFADVSRLHAEISRDDEGYVLESGRDVQVNGQSAKRTVLVCGDRITLGATCQLVFRRPVPISPTARLELVSGHRLPLAVDGVLLMAESLLLGAEGRVHVGLPDGVPGNVVLYRSKDGLGIRCEGSFIVDGRPCEGRSPLPLPCVVSTDRFTFAVEPIGARM